MTLVKITDQHCSHKLARAGSAGASRRRRSSRRQQRRRRPQRRRMERATDGDAHESRPIWWRGCHDLCVNLPTGGCKGQNANRWVPKRPSRMLQQTPSSGDVTHLKSAIIAVCVPGVTAGGQKTTSIGHRTRSNCIMTLSVSEEPTISTALFVICSRH